MVPGFAGASNLAYGTLTQIPNLAYGTLAANSQSRWWIIECPTASIKDTAQRAGIQGVCGKSMVWRSKTSLNEGQYVICPFEYKIIGTAKGGQVHTLLTTFDDKEWQIITLVVNRLDSHLKYTDLFAATCRSIGEFTNIKKT